MTDTAVVPPPETKPKRIKKSEREIIDVTDGRRVLECNRCEKLCDSRKLIVNGSGPKHARVAVIGEAPGEIEDDRGKPFIGPAGTTVRNWLVKVGLNPERDVYFDNAVKCRPEANRTPTAREIAACNEHLWAALEEVQPDIIVAAGNPAIAALLPPTVAAQGITKVRGHVFWNERLQRKIVPMFHPSSAFHDFGQEIFCLADLRKAVKESKNPTKLPLGLGEYTPLLTVEAVERECERLFDADVLSFDTETAHSSEITCDQAAGIYNSLNWREGQLLCVSFASEVGSGYVVPLVGQNFRQIWTPSEYEKVIAALRRLLGDPEGPPLVAQNGKYDVHWLREFGINCRDLAFDTMLAYSFIHESASHSLESMRSLYTTLPFYDADIYEQTDGKKHMERAEEDAIWTYAGADVDCALRVAKELDLLLDEEGEPVRNVFENIVMPLQKALTHIEQRGVAVDMVQAGEVIKECDSLITHKELEFFSAIPEKWQTNGFNFDSWQHKQKLLYVDLKLPLPPVLTDTGAFCKECRDRKTQHYYHTSTDKNAIKELEGAHPCIEPLQTLLQLRTLKKSFLLGLDSDGTSGLLSHVQRDGRIHTSYRADLETGRLGSSPNLQNAPKEADDRPEIYQLIRKLFIAPSGRMLVECDFSQIELRILAYLAGETDMIKRFEANEDFHLHTARRVLWPDLDPDLSDPEWRAAHDDRRNGAKRVNFGIPYGLTAFGMSQWLHCTEDEAADHINAYFGFFTHVRDYFRHSDRDLKRRGIRTNAFGRRRHFFGINTMQHFGGYRRMLGHMKREAYNFPIQSTAADVLSWATVAIDTDPWFEENDAFIVLTVHDSVTLECREEVAKECGYRVLAHFLEAGKQLMYTTAAEKQKPYYLPGEAKIGQRWSDWMASIDVEGVYTEKKAA